MLNRKIPPPIREIRNLVLPEPAIHYLDNGVRVYETNMGTQEILKLEVVFHAGRPYEHKHMVARATARLLREGTLHMSAADIAETIDFYGGTISTPVNLDTANVILYSLTKHFDKLLPLLAEILYEPSFPEQELQTFIENNRQRLLVELRKNDVIAYRKITELIFGEDHPYGYNSVPETYTALTRDDLLRHHRDFYTSDNCTLFLSGKIEPHILPMINQYLGQKSSARNPVLPHLPEPPIPPRKLVIPNPDTVQTAIRIGRRLFNRQHPDYAGLYVLNTILGGYFGSRLMTNIREEKGYTYNIYATIDPMEFDGYLYIASEVGNEFVEKTLTEIYNECQLLCEEPIEEDELGMVRSYLMGTYLNMIDGPFNVSELIRTLVIDQVPLSHFHQLVETTRMITAAELQALARQYLRREELCEVIVGA